MREATRPARLSHALANGILIVASTLIAIVAAEVVARCMGDGPQFGLVDSLRGAPTRTVDGVTLWTARGVRADGEDVRRVAKETGAFKIIGLGDSIMFGVGEPKENTYLEQARRALASRSKRSVEILNLSIPGYNTVQENAVYKEIEGQIQPDLVIVHYWGNDVRQFRVIGGYVVDFADVSASGQLVIRALPLPPDISDFLLIHSRLYDLLTTVVVNYKRRNQRDDWTLVSQPLTEIHERVQRAGGRLLILASAELDGQFAKPTADIARLREFAATRGIEVIDLSEWLHGISAERVRMDGCHFNAEGHRLIGERLAEYLLEHDLKERD